MRIPETQSKNILFACLLTAVYAAAVIFFTSYHELWRDELVPLSVARGSHSLAELQHEIRYFGHPGLWYLILYVATKIFSHVIVLQVANIAVCILAVFLFLWKAPFDRLFKCLFISGVLPLYIFPVIARSYGLGMLTMFLVCVCYRRRWEQFVPFALALALLINTHAHLFIVAIAVLLSLLVEWIFCHKVRLQLAAQKKAVLLGMAIIVGSMVLTYLQIKPPAESIVFTPSTITLAKAVEAFVRALLFPGKYFFGLFEGQTALFANVVIFTFYLFLLRRLNLFILFMAVVIALGMFFDLVYASAGIRHLSPIYFLMIMVMWMYYDTKDEDPIEGPSIFRKLPDYFQERMPALFMVILLMHMTMAYAQIRDEISKPYSSSKALAGLIDENPNLKDAIIMGFSEAYLESLPYYVDNPLYFHQRQRMAQYRTLTSDGLRYGNLDEMLEVARQLRSNEKKDVIILLTEKITPEGPYDVKFSYGPSYFHYSPEELERFKGATQHLVGFSGSLTDEDYNVYLLK